MPRFVLLACLILFLPSLSLIAEDDELHVPILMYHHIGEVPASADEMRQTLTLDPEIFREQIEYLDEAGYSTISLYDLQDTLTNGTELPEKPIILSFDDGYLEHYEIVFPLLLEHEMTATFFIISDQTDKNYADYMSWEQIMEMSEAGMSIEAHTRNHVDLSNRDEAFLEDEIMGSVDSIEEHTEIRPSFLAYPYGTYDDATLAFLENTDLLGAVTVQSGTWHSADNLFELDRLLISDTTTVQRLRIMFSYR